jgi:hypothetical protein
MRIQYKWVMLLFAIVFLQACTMPRLGVESVRYNNTLRQPTEADQYIPIYDSLDAVPFNFVFIGEVIVSPIRIDQEVDYDPLGLLRKQTREMGGIGLVEVKRGTSLDSRYEWRGKVIIEK